MLLRLERRLSLVTTGSGEHGLRIWPLGLEVHAHKTSLLWPCMDSLAQDNVPHLVLHAVVVLDVYAAAALVWSEFAFVA